MSEEAWRPLGVDSEDEVARYDALHEGLPGWIEAAYWMWVRDALTKMARFEDGSGPVPMLNVNLAEAMCQTLRIPLPDLRTSVGFRNGEAQLKAVMKILKAHPDPLQVGDYLLAHDGRGEPSRLQEILERGKSAWTVGIRSGRPGLLRRVPAGVQDAADSVMAQAGQAGLRLSRAWEELYGLDPSPSEAYRQAIIAVEDAAIPVVSPTNKKASLGTVLGQLESQGNWSLPLEREHSKAPTREVLVAMMRMLWHGQHDRHGGQPSAPGDVSLEEATVAVGVAVTLVHWFDAGLVARSQD